MPRSPLAFLFLLACLALLDTTGCTSSTEPAPTSRDTTARFDSAWTSAPAIRTAYDNTSGGVQITAIYYDQTKNGELTGVADEWVVLQCSGTVKTRGWTLNAGDAGQNYALPDSIVGRLVVYTHLQPDASSATQHSLRLSSSKFIWNNSDHDTARLFDDNGTLVDELTY